MARLFNPVFQPIQPLAIRATKKKLTTVCLRIFERVKFNFICCRSTLAVCTAALLAGLEMATILFIHWWWQLQSLGCTWILQLQRSAANFSFFNRRQDLKQNENYLECHQHCQQGGNLFSQADITYFTELLLLWEELYTRWSNRAGKNRGGGGGRSWGGLNKV